MATPAISIHDPTTTPSTVAVIPTARASGRRLAVGIDADDAGLVGGVGIDAVLRADRAVRRQSHIQPATRPPSPAAISSSVAGRVVADEPVEAPIHAKYTVTPAHSRISILTAGSSAVAIVSVDGGMPPALATTPRSSPAR